MLGWLVQKIKDNRAELDRLNAAMQLQAAERMAEEAARATLMDKVRTRFDGRVFMVPVEFRGEESLLSKGLDFDESDYVWWKKILDRFPTEPATNTEAKANEVRFWQSYANACTINESAGKPDLRKHADLIEFFKGSEKWVQRGYFAATGIVNDPLIKEACRLMGRRKDIGEYEKISPLYMQVHNEISAKRNEKKTVKHEQLDQEFIQFKTVTAPAHWEKWGGWFVSHVQDAFDQLHQQPAKPRGKLGDGGLGSLDEMLQRGRAAAGSTQGRAQSQTFKD